MRPLHVRSRLLRPALLALALLTLSLSLPGRAHALPVPPPIKTFGSVIDSINHTQDTNAFLQTLIPPSPITPPSPIVPPNPIDVSTLMQGNSTSALTNALARNAADITQMQTLLGQLTVLSGGGGSCDLCGQPMPLSSYLASRGIALNQVIAVGMSPNPPPIDQGSVSLQLVVVPQPPPIDQ